MAQPKPGDGLASRVQAHGYPTGRPCLTVRFGAVT